MMRVERVTPCEHGNVECDRLGEQISERPERYRACPGGSRSTVSGFSPEAVQAAANVIQNNWGDAENIARAALAAAWDTDFGDPT